MRRIRCLGIAVLLLAILLPGCSTEAMMEKGADLLDKMFAGDRSPSSPSAEQTPSAPITSKTDTGSIEPEEPDILEAVEPSIPEQPAAPAAPEPVDPDPAPSTQAGNITPSHTDATFFGPGESFRYLPKGAEGIYACTYASEDESIATVDQDTGKVTAVGPGTTNVTMHVECDGQYDFTCIVRCNWEDSGKTSGQPSGSDEPTLPPASGDTGSPAPSTDTITASHSDATFFNPKEHFQLLPVGVEDGYTCSYTTGDAGIASVSEKGVVTAVGPGTTTVTMTVDHGGSEYIFQCIVRCNFEAES